MIHGAGINKDLIAALTSRNSVVWDSDTVFARDRPEKSLETWTRGREAAGFVVVFRAMSRKGKSAVY
jgi:hypothetical protein